MIVKILEDNKEILVQTVSVSHDTEKPANVYLFRCMWCGNAISQIQGKTMSISPGLLPSNQVPVLSKCSKCGEVYTFQTHNTSTKSKTIRLTLSAIHHAACSCVICRTPLFDLYHPPLFPSLKVCTHCNTTYRLVDIL